MSEQDKIDVAEKRLTIQRILDELEEDRIGNCNISPERKIDLFRILNNERDWLLRFRMNQDRTRIRSGSELLA